MTFVSLTANSLIFGSGSIVLPDLLQVFHKALSSLTGKELSDDQCVKKLLSGDETPFQILFDRYGDLVFGYCVKLLKDRQRAEDASQEVWVKVIRNAGKYKSQGKFKAWLMQIARNTCFSTFRDLKKNFAEYVSDHEVEDITQQSILDLMSAEQDKNFLKKCIASLPESQRVALVVWMTEEKSYEDIAQDMDTSVSSIKSLLFRSRQKLKELMSEKNG